MTEFMQAMAIIAVAIVVVIALGCYGLYVGVRMARRQARRTAGRVARSMPVRAFGAEIWRLSGLVDNAVVRAGRAADFAGDTPFAPDAKRLSGELAAAAAPVRERLRMAGRLTEPARSRALDALRPDVENLVATADSLEALAARAVEAAVEVGATSPAADVRRRAAALHAAIEELTRPAPEPAASLPPAALPAPEPPRPVLPTTSPQAHRTRIRPAP